MTTNPATRPVLSSHQDFMNIALALARRGLGNVWPNPAVGCVIVRDGQIVGRGWTQPGGRPHAETEALGRAGALAKGAIAYVTLEPCNHTGETPPCSQALIDAGVAAVVIATHDPDPRVQGSGAEALRLAGIEVINDVCTGAADRLNAGFFSRLNHTRPLITLKLATSSDGKIATHTGESQWITGEQARSFAHGLRARHDAVLVGSGTAIADDPSLDCRLPGWASARDLRIVLDGRLRLTPDHKLIATAAVTPTWVVTTTEAAPQSVVALVRQGVEVITAPTTENGQIDIIWTVQEFARRGVTRLMVEGGATIAAAFVGADLIDTVAWFRAPILIGGDGRDAIDGFNLSHLSDAPRFDPIATIACGPDQLETYRRNR